MPMPNIFLRKGGLVIAQNIDYDFKFGRVF